MTPTPSADPVPADPTDEQLSEWIDEAMSKHWGRIAQARHVIAKALALRPATGGTAQAAEPLPANIESPFNACMHKEHCLGWKRAAAEPTEPKGEPTAEPAKLPYDVEVGHNTFSKGVALSTFILAARNWHRAAYPANYTLTDEEKAANLRHLQGLVAQPSPTMADATDRCNGCPWEDRCEECPERKADAIAAGEPRAWERRWSFDGEVPVKVKGKWPMKFKLLPITQHQCFNDDVALFASSAGTPPAIAAGEPSDEQIYQTAKAMPEKPWGTGSRLPDAIAFARAVLAFRASSAGTPHGAREQAALSVDCPHCWVKAGEPCIWPETRQTNRDKPHDDRVAALRAKTREAEDECPFCHDCHPECLHCNGTGRASSAGTPHGAREPAQLPESMSRDEMLKYYSDYANVQSNEALRYQKRIRDLEAALMAREPSKYQQALTDVEGILAALEPQPATREPKQFRIKTMGGAFDEWEEMTSEPKGGSITPLDAWTAAESMANQSKQDFIRGAQWAIRTQAREPSEDAKDAARVPMTPAYTCANAGTSAGACKVHCGDAARCWGTNHG